MADTAALLVPALPGGAGIKTIRATRTVADVADVMGGVREIKQGYEKDNKAQIGLGALQATAGISGRIISNTDIAKASANIGDDIGSGLKGTGNGLDGVRIINRKYADDIFELSGDLAKKYPDGVKFTSEGFPDFSPYAKAKVEINGLRGDYYHDFKAANEALGLTSTPKGYTWHHVEDGMTMMLIPSDVHSAVRHTGGASLINKGLRP